MDNCPFIKWTRAKTSLTPAGRGRFSRRYTPNLNPIEHCRSKVKARLRALKPRTVEDLLAALVELCHGHRLDIRAGSVTAGTRSHSREKLL